MRTVKLELTLSNADIVAYEHGITSTVMYRLKKEFDHALLGHAITSLNCPSCGKELVPSEPQNWNGVSLADGPAKSGPKE